MSRRMDRATQQHPWLLPLACLAAAVALALVTLAIDSSSNYTVVGRSLTGTPTAAQGFLTTVASSVITLLTLTLTVLTVAIQLAMGQFSPRIVQSLFRERKHQLALGLFGATAVYTLIAITRIDDQRGHVPGLTVLVAYVLTAASLIVLILYIHASGQALRVSSLIDLVGDNLHDQLQRVYPETVGDAGPSDPRIVTSDCAGAVVALDEDRLVALAEGGDVALELIPMMGDFVPAGAALLRIHGDPARIDVEAARRAIALAPERDHENDPAFALRKLVDIAVRAASDDPTTSVQALHRIHDALRQLAVRAFPDGTRRDGRGRVRLTMRTLDWAGYVRLAFEEIRGAADASPQIPRRLRAALEDLVSVAPRERRSPLEEQLRLLGADGDDSSDVQGLGSGADMARRAAEYSLD